jgi:hypothetical protein
MAPNDPLFNPRDTASRDYIRNGIIVDCFSTHFPLWGLMRERGAVDVLFQGTGILNPTIYDVAFGSSTVPGATLTPQRKQMATDSKFDIRFYQSNLPVEETVNKLYNAPGDTQIFSQEELDTYCLTKKLEMMMELDAWRHGQPAAGNPGGATGVVDDRSNCMNGLDEALNNGIDCGPFGNVYQYYGSILRNGSTGGMYNSTPYYCGTAAGAASSITYPILQGACAQIEVIGGRVRDGFVGPFGWGAMAVMFRTASVTIQSEVSESSDLGWRSVNFNGLTVHSDPLAPSSVAFNYLPGGNPAAFGTTSTAKYSDGVGSNTKLSSFTSPTYQIYGSNVAAGTLSPTGSNIPSATTINPGEALYLVNPEDLVLLPPKPGSGWEFDKRDIPIFDNISTNNLFMKVATNVTDPQPPHGMIVYGFKGVRS